MRGFLKYFFLTLILLNVQVVLADNDRVRVGLLHKNKLYYTSMEVAKGSYQIIADGVQVGRLKKGQKIHISHSEHVKVSYGSHEIYAHKIVFRGEGYVNQFALSSMYQTDNKYDDNLEVSKSKYGLKLVNDVDIEKYVAAVVEGEAGYKQPLEFYKLQAILSRTYVLKNRARHINEGFSVCDKVHCQVYHKKSTQKDIYQATNATHSLVVVDNKLDLIQTIFHSNCGGQTCNSEDVWNQKLDYLRSVKDSFCLNSRRALWSKSFPSSSFSIYMKKQGASQYSALDHNLLCQVDQRSDQTQFLNVPLTKMRRDLKLMSTYFYIEEQGDSTKLYGRGFGHGVGLCQQGGIEMAKQGYSYVDILKHYYQNIHILNREALWFFTDGRKK